MKRFSISEMLSIIIAVVCFLIFGAMFVGCYVWAFVSDFSLMKLVAAFLLSVIPGCIARGIGLATMEFVLE